MVVIGNTLTCGFSGNVPLLLMSTQRLDMSLHVISFTKPSPTLVLQATNAEVRRPGYEANAERVSPVVLYTSMISTPLYACSFVLHIPFDNPLLCCLKLATLHLYLMHDEICGPYGCHERKTRKTKCLHCKKSRVDLA